MPIIPVNDNKTLKLTNALFYTVTENDLENVDLVVEKIKNYILSKGSFLSK